MRLFIALEFPADVKAYLANLAIPLPGARWVTLDNLHLTLFFIGHVTEATMNTIHDTLRHLAVAPFSVIIHGVKSFSIKGKVRSLWAGIDPNDAVIDLHTNIHTVLSSIGHASDKRTFTPHVTLARFRNVPAAHFKTMTTQHVDQFLQDHRLLRVGPVRIQNFTLFESVLGRTTLYRPLHRYPCVVPPVTEC